MPNFTHAHSRALRTAAVTHVGFDGVDFNGSNCGCLPPDTNAAVGPNHVVAPVNVQIRIFDKLGNILLDEPLAVFFGAPSGGDPYAVYDDISNRWYVTGFDSDDNGLFLAVSVDSNPLDGFNVYDFRDVGGFPDYNKVGFNKDAIFISYNDFGPNGDAGIKIVTVPKNTIFAGNPLHYVSHPAFQFRAQPPAQYHGDITGGKEWFLSTDGTDAGGNTIRVMKMTNYFSNSPTFTYWSLPVPYYQSATTADQPGAPGSITVFPNTTFTQGQLHRGYLVGAMASGAAADGYVYPKVQWFQVYVGTGTPILLQHGIIDPGPGVAAQMPAVDQDSANDLGFGWTESSNSEYLSMWVGTRFPVASGVNANIATPGAGFMPYGFRLGDYGTTVLDPSNGLLFWSANEWVGQNGFSDIWQTHIQSFSAR